MHQLSATGSVVVCLGLLLTGCGSNAPLTSASPLPPTALAAPAVLNLNLNATLSGVVAGNGHPIENAAVAVQWSCGGGCSSETGGMTDAAGRYVIARLPDGTPVWVTAHKDGFVQQCAATAVMRAGVSVDVQLTSIASLSTAQPVSGAGFRTLSGTVFESTPAGRRLVADTWCQRTQRRCTTPMPLPSRGERRCRALLAVRALGGTDPLAGC